MGLDHLWTTHTNNRIKISASSHCLSDVKDEAKVNNEWTVTSDLISLQVSREMKAGSKKRNLPVGRKVCALNSQPSGLVTELMECSYWNAESTSQL